MKKITACIVLSLLMCLAMAFPASAVVNVSESSDIIMSTLSEIDNYAKSRVPSNYKYKIVYAPNKDYITPARVILGVVYCSTNNLKVGDKYYIITKDSYFSTFSYYEHTLTAMRILNSGSYIATFDHISFPSSQGNPFSNYFTDLSTATFYIYNELLSQAAYDFEVSISINTTALQSLITTAKSKQNTGYSASTWQALQNSITAAESLLNTTGYTQAQVDAEKDTLQAALDNLRLLPDVSELQALINQAQAIQKDTHTPETWQSLQDAISSAQAILSTSDYTQSEIESALSNLQAAISGLDYLPDTTDLEALVEEADQIEDIGYTEPSWNRFDTARTSAHVLLARTSYTATEVQTTGTELRAAMNALTLIVVTPPVEPPKIPDADYYNVPENAKKYLNIKDGITPEHLLPAKDAIFEHLETSKKYGLWVYFISLLPIIGIIIFVNFINSGNDVIALNGGNPRYLNSSSTMYGSDGSDRKRLGR